MKKLRSEKAMNTKKVLNPFEVHINRQKFNVLGKKTKKDRGLPGISRSKAIKKRKSTLLQEYKLKDKSNKFYDRRIGEKNSAMTAEDKILARYTAQRLKAHSKKAMYNLDSNEVLTHRGESLAEIEKFEDPKSDDDYDDDNDDRMEDGKLSKDFVSGAHFGGGMFKKLDGESQSRKDLIEKLIAESKIKKAEKQKAREELSNLTDKLDSEWKNLFPEMMAKKTKLDDVEDVKTDRKFLSYDMLSKQLKFEARGRAQDKLKSEEEMAREEKLKLEKLELERLQRMMQQENSNKIKHRSADDLDDNFYHVDSFKKNDKEVNSEDDPSSSEAESEDGEDEDEINNCDKDGEEEEEDEEGEGNVEDKNEEESDSEDDVDDLSELKSSEAESDPETEIAPKKKLSKPKELEKVPDLPFIFIFPKNYESFEKLMHGHNVEEQGIIVERLIKSNYTLLQQSDKAEMTNLLAYILQHFQDTASSDVSRLETFKLLDKFSPIFFDLTQSSPNLMASALSDVIREKYETFLKHPRRYPDIDTLVFLKLVSVLFPTSDFRHRVVTPTLSFILHMLGSCRVRNTVDLSKGLFLCTLALEFTAFSKRLVPQANNFLRGVLRLCLPSGKPPPVPFSASNSSLSLHTTSDTHALGCLETRHLCDPDESDCFKINAVHLSLKLISNFISHFEEPTALLIYEPFLEYLIPKHYSTSLRPQVEKLLEQILKFKESKLLKLAFERKRPQPLKLYEPKIEEVYTFKKRKPMSKEKQEHEKLVHKYKREVKGALREIRRDKAFLSKIKYNETKASDLERQKKVKEIYNDAAQQMGDLRKLKKPKK